jgi:oligosaccharide repeat unit polymerase
MAAVLMLSITVFMVIVSPLRWISPSALLAGAWAFVYTLQSVFAPDMYSSLLATTTIFTITMSFSTGELLGCGGMRRIRLGDTDEKTHALHTHEDCQRARQLKKYIVLLSLLILPGVAAYAYALGLFRATSFDELLILPGIARLAMANGYLSVPLYSRIGILLACPGVVLALAYYYIYKWSWWLLLPIIGVILFGMSQSGRAGTTILLLQIMLSVYLKETIILKRSVAGIFFKCAVLPGIFMAIVFIGGEFLREGFHSMEFKDIMRVIHSSRSYLFGGVSAFSYWICHIYNWNPPTFGRYSFSSLFSVLGIFPQMPGIYDYYAPIANSETSNIYTAYRSFIEDYTIVGACLIYFVAGIFIASITRKLVKGDDTAVLLLIPLLSWLAFSPMASVTYFNSFLLSCILPYLLVRHIWRTTSVDDSILLR